MPQQKRTATTAFLAANHGPAPSIDESATLCADSTAEPPKRLRATGAVFADGGAAGETERVPETLVDGGRKRRLAGCQAEEEKERRKTLPAEDLIPVEELRDMGHEELVRYAFMVGEQAGPGTDLRAIKWVVEAPAALRERGDLLWDPVMMAAVAGELDDFESEMEDDEDEDEDEGDEDDVEGGEGGDGFEDGDEDEDEDGEAVDARWTRRKITGWIPTSPPPKPNATQKARRRYRSRKRARRDAERKLKTVAAAA